MSRIILVIPAGVTAALLGGVMATFTEDVAVDFGETTHDELAQLFAQAPASEAETIPFMQLLEHEENGVVIKYTPQGNRVQSVEEERFDRVREAVEEGLEEIDSQQVQDEAEQDRQADLISEKVARSTDAITSPSEAAEAAAIANNQEPAPPAQQQPENPQVTEDGNSDPLATPEAPESGSSDVSQEPSGSPVTSEAGPAEGSKVFTDDEAEAQLEG